jgi:pyridoxamine 5'-phosphate oxidase
MDPIADIRTDYRKQALNEEDTAAAPMEQFKKWWDAAVASEIHEVNAMTLATVNDAGQPAARIVLLKGLHDDGFIFFTNYESRKANELAKNSHAALVFFWKELERQVRVEGIITKVSDEESSAYFHSRPHDSQIGAWSSPQSKVIPSRELLDKNVAEHTARFGGGEVERPPFWGGYILKPALVEFWQGRSNRLHDRIEYVNESGSWIKRRLAP